MHQYLFRDGSRVHLLTAPDGHDVFSYEDVSGQLVHAALSVQAERTLIRSVDLNTSLHRSKAQLALA